MDGSVQKGESKVWCCGTKPTRASRCRAGQGQDAVLYVMMWDFLDMRGACLVDCACLHTWKPVLSCDAPHSVLMAVW